MSLRNIHGKSRIKRTIPICSEVTILNKSLQIVLSFLTTIILVLVIGCGGDDASTNSDNIDTVIDVETVFDTLVRLATPVMLNACMNVGDTYDPIVELLQTSYNPYRDGYPQDDYLAPRGSYIWWGQADNPYERPDAILVYAGSAFVQFAIYDSSGNVKGWWRCWVVKDTLTDPWRMGASEFSSTWKW